MKLLCIDGNSILNRAFYGIKLLATHDGRHTNAIQGFMNILIRLMNDHAPDAVAVAFDMRAKTFRHKMYDGYKATRKGMPEELAEQKRRRAEEEAAERAAERRRRRELREAERKNRPKLFTPGMPARRRRYMLSRVIFATAFLVVSTVLLGIVVWVFYVSRVFGTVIDWLLIGLCVPAFAAMLFVYARYLATLNYEYDAHYVD